MQKILCKKNKKVNKKGFTLVELLICIAIMAVIALLLAEFVASSTGAYRRISSQTKIQETCQSSLIQISNIVRNSKSLVVTKEANGKITMESKNYKNQNVLLVYVPDVKDNDYGRIYVDYNYVSGDITKNPSGEQYNDYLLTDMVKGFTVNYATYNAKNDKGQNYVEVQERTLDMVLTLEKNDKEFSQNYKASLRNSSPEGQTTELTIQIVNR